MGTTNIVGIMHSLLAAIPSPCCFRGLVVVWRRWVAWLALSVLLFNLAAPLQAPAPVVDDLLHAVCTVGGMVRGDDGGAAPGADVRSCAFCLPLLHGGPAPLLAGLVLPMRVAAGTVSLPPITKLSSRPAPSPLAPRAPPR